MRAGLAIEGSGLGAVAAAASLARMGHPVVLPALPALREGGPFLVLNEKALWMINDLFGTDVLRDVRADGVEITHRRLRWGGERIETLPERSLSVAAGRLAAHLVATVETARAIPISTVRARGRLANTGVALRPLTAFVWDLPQPTGVGMDWSATMSVGQAWAAVAPMRSGGASLQVYIPSGTEAEARAVGAQVLWRLGIRTQAVSETTPQSMDASARLGTGWEEAGCAVGDEALALDPLAGDGFGHTIRAALWMSALLSAEELSDGMRRKLYCRRMVAAFQQHQGICARYYGMLR